MELKAIITIHGPNKGGLLEPVKDGLRPSFNYSGNLLACEVWSTKGCEYVPLDEPFEVTIRLPYADKLGWIFHGGEHFLLNIASKIIGVGRVLENLEDIHAK